MRQNIMNKTWKEKLTMDRPADYQIKVPGHLDSGWLDLGEQIKVDIGNDPDGLPVSILTGRVDQAALLSLLRRLYNWGVPLIAVVCLEV
jgi:hypothetical protein